MKLGLTAAASVAAAFAAAAFASGVATASGPDVTGQTYSKAAQTISNWGDKVAIASVVGDQLETSDCIVTSSVKASNRDSSGRSRGNQILVNLDCNAPVASPGKPGNSAASPEGRVTKKELGIVEWFGKDPEANCAGSAYCRVLCEKYPDNCSPALQDYVATKLPKS
jgi:hypothetical protein